MARPPATPPRSDDLAFLPTAGELPSEAAAKPPEWIRIAPAGELKCRDGRAYTLDPKALVARFNADRVDIPVDLGHGMVSDKAAPALAWIDVLQARDDGLYGHVREWLDGGRAVLKARTHRYVSPAFLHDDRGAATWLHSVALVAAPALAMAALLNAQPRSDETGIVGEFASALGLDAGATRASCLAAVAEMRAGAVPLGLHEQALATLSTVRSELTTLKAGHRAEKVEALITGALKEIKITPSERDGYMSLCATDLGLDTVERLFAAMSPKIGPSILENRRAESGGPERRTPETLAAAATALQTERAAKGLPTISYADAMGRVVADPTLG